MIKVSVLIPVYNQEELIKKCIESVPNREDVEIVVVDDGSTDNTFNITQEVLLPYHNYKLLKNTKNIGIGLTRNKLLENATGEYIFFLDSDDFVYTDGFNKVVDNFLTADIVKPKRLQNDGNEFNWANVFQGWFVKTRMFDGCKCPDANYSEDADLAKQVYENNKGYTTRCIIKTAVYHYNFPRIGSAVWQAKFHENIICAIAKNENRYINEWVKYHINLGFDHIYIFDNNDKDAIYIGDAIEENYKENVTIFDKRGLHDHCMQIRFYNDFYKKYNIWFDWCAFIDIDEFITLRDWDNIKEFLSDKRFDKFNIIRLKWHLHGDENLLFRDARTPVFKDLNKTYITNKSYPNQGKHIIRGGLGKKVEVCSCHYSFIDGQVKDSCYPDGTTTTDKITLTGKYGDEAWLDHYMTKTISEFVVQKYNRGDACFDKRKIDWDYFWKLNDKTPEKEAYIKCVENPINCWYYASKNNAGDIYTKFLLKAFGLEMNFVNKENADLLMTGSILQQVKNNRQYVIGSGFHNVDNAFKGDKSKILGVRGKLTAEKLELKDLPVGDPGLLLSYIYKPVTKKKYKYGIIAHYTDYAYLKKFETKNCPVINMGLKSDSEAEFYELIDKINECEFIFSSSLHGIIFSHSLEIPAVHLENEMLVSKDNFKFKDYYSTIDLNYIKLSAKEKIDFNEITNHKSKYLPSKKIINSLQNNLISEIKTFINKITNTVDPEIAALNDFEPENKIVKQTIKPKNKKKDNRADGHSNCFLYF